MNRIFSLVLAAVSVCALASDDAFVDRKNGVTLIKPPGWEITPPLPKPEGTDAAKRPERIVQIVKYPAGHEGPNPSFVMSLQPLPFAARGLSPAGMLRQLVPNLTRALPGLEFQIQPRDVPIMYGNTGLEMLPGGEMLFRYTAKDAAGNPYQARSRMMYIVRGEELFAVQTTAPASGPDASSEEFNGLIASIRIAR